MGPIGKMMPTYSTAYSNKCTVDKQWLRGRFDRVLPARSWEMPVKCELPAKIGRCNKKPPGRNFDFRAKSSWEDFFMYIKKSSQSKSTSKTIYSYYDLSLPSYLQTPQCKSSKSLIDFKWSFPERDKTERLINGAGASLWTSVAVAGDFANDSFSYRFIL